MTGAPHITNCVLFHLGILKFEKVQYVQDQAQAGPEGRGKLRDHVAQRPTATVT